MHGWRGRLGLIVPSSNTTNEPEFYRRLPSGVSLHTARMSLEETNAASLERMADDVERCARLLGTADVDAIAYGCTTGSLVKGTGYDERIEARIEETADAPAVATAGSIKRAFDALGLESLAIATPYVEDLNEREREFLADAGYEVRRIDGLGIEANTGIGDRTPESTYRQCKRLYDGSADGLFVSCTNYRTLEIVDRLERDLGVPVVTSNQATLWDVLGTLGIEYEGPPLGRLFEQEWP